MEVESAEYVALFLGAPLIIGALVRRWWLLGVASALFAAQATYMLLAGVDSRDLGPLGLVVLTVIAEFVPVVAGLTIGVLVGRRLRPPGRHREQAPPLP